jgi:hypothetical protein
MSGPGPTPTPDAELRDEAYRRTDAIVAYSANGRPWPGYYIPLAKHIELERELAEARADARRQRGLATKYMLERNDARYDLGEARELIAVKERSLHAASAAIHDINQSMVGALRFIDEVSEQRDRLAEALRPFTTLNTESKRVREFWHGFVTNAREALAAVKEPNASVMARPDGGQNT